MNLPHDITKTEMIGILHELWNEYLPNEDGSFLDTLDEEGLKRCLELITERDEAKRKQMRNDIEQRIAEHDKKKKLLVQEFFQKTNKIMLSYRENRAHSEDNADLEKLEANF